MKAPMNVQYSRDNLILCYYSNKILEYYKEKKESVFNWKSMNIM